MRKRKNLYTHPEWIGFAEMVKKRDGYKCTNCGKGRHESVLQVHHPHYKLGFKPWEYAISDCVTLCKGCHAATHGKVEPTSGWILLSMDDLGGLNGHCERKGCGSPLRYEMHIFHEAWGHKVVGTTCVEYLTEQWQSAVSKILKVRGSISKSVNSTKWKFDPCGIPHYYFRTKGSELGIFGRKGRLYFRVEVNNGNGLGDNKDEVHSSDLSLDQMKELAYITFLGRTSEDPELIEILRDFFKIWRGHFRKERTF